MFKPRLYQIEAVKSVEGKNGIIVCPTGSGKSVIIAEICKKLLGKILILQPSLEILNQNATKIINATNEEIGVYSASAGKKTISRITLATIQSIKDKNLFIDYKNVICDEAHLVNAKGGKYQELIDFIKPKYLIGLTATPYRMFQTKLYGVQYRLLWNTRPKIFKKLLYVYQNYEIYKDGYWSKIKYFQYKYNENGLIKNKLKNDFDENLIVKINKNNNIYNHIENICKITKSKRILIFATKIQEAEFIANKIGANVITGKSKDREEILNKFSNGEIRILVNVGVLTTGYDLPILDCVILARPTMSLSLYCQMVGRGLRIHNQKLFFELYDLCGNVKRFGKVEDMELTNEYLKSNIGDLIGVSPSNYIVDFGKYKNKKIEDREIPIQYIKWVSDNFNKKEIKNIFKKELVRRSK